MMMSKTKKRGGTGIKFLGLIPIVIMLFLVTASFKTPAEARSIMNNKLLSSSGSMHEREAFANQLIVSEADVEKAEINNLLPKDTIKDPELVVTEVSRFQEYITAVSPTKMNVLYLGVDNPVSIAVTGAEKGKITAEIDNGSISGENGNYNVRVKQMGLATITVKVDGKVISESKFRVKVVPDPIATIKGKFNKGGDITKQELLDAGGIEVVMTNFDFDLKFEVVSFSISAVIVGGIDHDYKARGSNFSKDQIELIKLVEPGKKIYIEDIQVKGPDDTIRNLGALTFKIK